MTEKIQDVLITRRTAFPLGLSAVFGLMLPVSLCATSPAKAQTAGMERREDRREGRQDRRHTRQEGRHERRDTRRGGGSKPESTGSGTGTK